MIANRRGFVGGIAIVLAGPVMAGAQGCTISIAEGPWSCARRMPAPGASHRSSSRARRFSTGATPGKAVKKRGWRKAQTLFTSIVVYASPPRKSQKEGHLASWSRDLGTFYCKARRLRRETVWLS